MTNKINKKELTKSLMGYFKELMAEHDVRSDNTILFSEDSTLSIFNQWRDLGVAKLPALEKAVDAMERKVDRHNRRARIEGEYGLVRDAEGQMIVNAANIRQAITELGIRLSHDVFKGTPLISGLTGFGPSLDDHAMRRMWLMLESEFGFRPPRQLFDEVALDLAYQGRFHPVKDYLDYVITWDGTPRLDTWLIQYAGAKDTPFVRAVSAMVLIAAARRIRSPGTKFDEMLVLESEVQGLGKSSLVAALAIRSEWFTDSLPMGADDKRVMEAMAGKLIAEIGELQGMRRGEIEHIRAQLSRASDRARMAYARLPEDRPRAFVMIGTTNASRSAPYLADIDGNRRFWPV